jgi:hypothetical protein
MKLLAYRGKNRSLFMKKIFFMIFFTINIFCLYADGRAEKDRQPYTQIQLKIINKSNSNIKFYYNRLYKPVVVNANEEFISMKMPQNSEFAGYFAIEYENGSFRIYKRRILGEPGPDRIDLYYNVFIENNELKIIRTSSSFEDIEGRHDEFYWGNGLFFDSKAVMTEGGIGIVFKNNTNKKIELIIFEPFSEYIHVTLDAENEFNYRIGSDIFKIHGIIEARIRDRLYWDTIYLYPYNLYDYDYNRVDWETVLTRSLSQIKIVINEDGYTKTNIYQYY